jgi:acylphosphatase
MVHYEIKITGRVQGVGFRQFVKDKARQFNVNGWVKNMRDGSVFVKAEGDEKDMEPFLDHLKRGPSMGRVDNFKKDKFDTTSGFSDFGIKF